MGLTFGLEQTTLATSGEFCEFVRPSKFWKVTFDIVKLLWQISQSRSVNRTSQKVTIRSIYRIRIASIDKTTTITLSHIDSPVVVADVHAIIQDVSNVAGAAASVVCRHIWSHARPNFYSGAVLLTKSVCWTQSINRSGDSDRRLLNGDVGNGDVLHNVYFAAILAQ